MENNLLKIYNAAKAKNENMPDYDQFRIDMKDDKNRMGIYNALKRKNKDVPDFDTFSRGILADAQRIDKSSVYDQYNDFSKKNQDLINQYEGAQRANNVGNRHAIVGGSSISKGLPVMNPASLLLKLFPKDNEKEDRDAFIKNNKEKYLDANKRQRYLENSIDLAKLSDDHIDFDPNDSGWKNLWKGATESGLLKDFATFGLTEMIRLKDIKQVADKQSNGEKLNPEEETLLRTYGALKDIQNEKPIDSIGYGIGQSVKEMIPFMLEFAATGGVTSGLRAGLKGALKVGVNGTKNQLVRKLGVQAIESVPRSMLAQDMIGKEYEQRRLNNYNVDKDGNATMSDNPTSALGDYYRAAASNWTEFFSEDLGGLLKAGRTGMNAVDGAASAIGKRYNKVKGTKFWKWGEKGLEKVGWNGGLGEYIEENVGNVMQAALTGDSGVLDSFNMKDQLILVGSVLTMGGAMRGIQYTGSGVERGVDWMHQERSYNMANKAMNTSGIGNVDAIKKAVEEDESIEEAVNVICDVSKGLNEQQQKALFNYSMAGFARKGRMAAVEKELAEKTGGFINNQTGTVQIAEDIDGNSFFVTGESLDGDNKVYAVSDGDGRTSVKPAKEMKNVLMSSKEDFINEYILRSAVENQENNLTKLPQEEPAGNDGSTNVEDDSVSPTQVLYNGSPVSVLEESPREDGTILVEGAEGIPMRVDANELQQSDVGKQDQSKDQSGINNEQHERSIPLTKDGKPDYNAMLESDPDMFASEWEKRKGPDGTKEALLMQSGNIGGKIDQIKKRIAKETDFNKIADLEDEVGILVDKKSKIDGLISERYAPKAKKGKLQYRVHGDPQTEHSQPNVSMTTSQTDDAGVSKNKVSEVSGENKEVVREIKRARVLNFDGKEYTGDNLSREVDYKGNPFVLSSNGTTDFGVINKEQADAIGTGVEAPIRLSMGNEGYGKIHIDDRIGQLRQNGYNTTEEFVSDVVNSYDEIRGGNLYVDKDGEAKETFLLVKNGNKGSVLYVELAPDGLYYDVNSGGVFKNSYIEKRDLLWNVSTEHSTISGESQGFPLAQLNPESDNVSALPQSESLSDNKDTEFFGANQGVVREIKRARVLNFDGKEYTGDIVSEVDGRVVVKDDVTGRKVSVPEKRVEERLMPTQMMVDIREAESKVNISPTEAQKKAGNYKMGHIEINGFDVTIENPKGSVRSGVDQNGKSWSQPMNNTYGYFKGTTGKDGDHIDVFIGNNPDSKSIFVVDQLNPDGLFDEHKVMMGFNTIEEARNAYLSNYEEGWKGLGNITGVELEEFRKWADSGTRKLKPFAEYKQVKDNGAVKNRKDGLQGAINSVSLLKDNQNENEISESIPQGKYGAVSEEDSRIEEALSELRRRSEKDARDAQKAGGTLSGRQQKEVEDRAAERYAKEKGIWIPMSNVFSLGEPAPSGNENDVYLSSKDNSVYKVNNLMNSGNISSLLERIKLHNLYFPQTKYDLVGFSGFENRDVFPVLKQDYVENTTFATPEEINEYMGTLGLKQTGEAEYSNNDIVISDLRPRNVLKDVDGDIYVIDADFKVKDDVLSNIEEEIDSTDQETYSDTGEIDEDGIRFREVKEIRSDDSANNRSDILSSEKDLEVEAIKKKAIAYNVFMKAPNGKPTNLTEKQWIQVRTKAFKDWFGDWEKAARIEKLRKSLPIEITEEEYKGKYELNRDSIKSWIKNNLRGTYTNKDTGEDILLAKGGVQKVISHSIGNEAHLKSIAAIPQLIEDSIFIDEIPNEKGNNKYDSYRYYIAGLKIDGVDYTAKIIVGVKQGKRYYDHSLTRIEKGNLIEAANGFTTTGDAPVPPYANYKDTKLLSILQTNSSKVVDGNGEPKVVYHGSSKSFTEFNQRYMGVNGTAIGQGFYFTNDKSFADGYSPEGGNVFEVFLNLRKELNSDKVTIKKAQLKRILKGIDDVLSDEVAHFFLSNYNDVEYNGLERTLNEAVEIEMDAADSDVELIGGLVNMSGSLRVVYDVLEKTTGHDGILGKQKDGSIHFVVGRPNQIKSATDNTGSFSKGSDDIRFREVSDEFDNIKSGDYVSKDGVVRFSVWENDKRTLSLGKEGDFCSIERVFTESGLFSFTSGEKIESLADVAYIFKNLENSSIENAFAVMVKSGTPTVIHLGMGNFNSSILNLGAIRAACDSIVPDQVFFVHNHPSGEVKASIQDIAVLRNLNNMLPHGVLQDGIIINIKSGKFGVFNSKGESERKITRNTTNDVPIKLYTFDKQVFAPNFNPEKLSRIRSSEDVAGFISSHRLGDRKKVSFLILNQANGVIGNIHTEFISIDDPDMVSKKIVTDCIHFGGTGVILYGDFELKNIKDVVQMVNKKSGGTIVLVDGVSVRGNNSNYISAQDDGVMENSGEYKQNQSIRSKKVSSENVNELFNSELDRYKSGKLGSEKVFNLGKPQSILRSAGLQDKEITMNQGVLSVHLKKHSLTIDDIKGLPNAIQNPIMVYEWGGKAKSLVVITALSKGEHHITAAIKLERKGQRLEVNEVASVHGKSVERLVSEMVNPKRDDFERDLLKYVNKEKALDWLSSVSSPLEPSAITDQELSSATKIVEKFENPTLEEGEISSTIDNLSDELGVKINKVVDRKDLPNGVLQDGVMENSGEYKQNQSIRSKKVSSENVNERFNGELDRYKEGKMGTKNVFVLGRPLDVLRSSGFQDKEITMTQKTLSTHLEKHGLSVDDIRNLPDAIQNPVMVYEWGSKAKSLVVITNLVRGDHRITTAIKLERKGQRLEVNEVASVHGKSVERLILEMNDNRSDFGKEKLRYVNKEKALDWLSATMETPLVSSVITDQELSSATKIVENFENPTLEEGEISSTIDNLSDELGVKINKVVDRKDLPKDIQGEMKNKHYSGMYDPKTGEVYIVLNEIRDVADAEATILHEILGHKGIRGLFGDKLNEFTDRVLKSNGDDIKQVNTRFNEKLQQQVEGTLPEGHIYQLGKPSRVLLSAGIPNLPIELASSTLNTKAGVNYQNKHPFDLIDVVGLPNAIHDPVAIFNSKTRPDSKVILTELQHDDVNFVVAMQIDYKKQGGKIVVNSVRSLYPKDQVVDILNWVNDGLLRWTDKKKTSDFLSKLPSQFAQKLHGKPDVFESVTKIVENFENPTLTEGEISSEIDRISDELGVRVKNVKDRGALPDGIQRKMKNGRYPGLYDVSTGEVYMVMNEIIDPVDAQATMLHEIVGHKGIHGLFGENLPKFCDKVLDSMNEQDRNKLLEDYDNNKQLAAEEYVASFAEGYTDPTAWEKVKAIVKDLLRELGIDLKLSDNDLKYVLWMAKNGLRDGDTMIDVARKVTKDRKMQNILFREKEVSDDLDDFSKKHLSFKELAREELQDRMLSVKMLLDEIKKRGGNISDYTNVYVAENLSTSKSKVQMEAFDKNVLKPLLDEIYKFVEKGKNLDEIDLYMMAKHAPERNALLLERDGVKNGSGITDADAKIIVDTFEKKLDVTKFWENVQNATEFTVDTWYKHGIVTKDTRDYYKQMYKYYVPLRGWADGEAKDIDYLSTSRGNGVISLNRKAEGRSSVADSPLAYIANMAHSAIVSGNKNDIKRSFFELIVANPNKDLYSIKKTYHVNTGTEENPIWIEQIDMPSNDLWKSGRVKTVINHRNDVKRTPYQTREHQVEVLVNGQRYIMELNGNMGVKIASAINGINLRRSDILQNSVGKLTRWMSANYTSKSPAFVVTNFLRDFGYAVPAYWMKGGNAFVLMGNMRTAFAAIHNDLSGKNNNKDIQKLYQEFKDNGGLTGYVHMTDIESYKKKIERDIRRMSGEKTMGDVIWRNKGMLLTDHCMDYLAQMSENSTRFAVYMSERQIGKSPMEAAYASKEITTNFNRKGRMSGIIGSLYAFFNATVQGTYNALSLAKHHSKKFVAYSASIITMQLLASQLCRLFGGDDEFGNSNYDNLSDWVKYNNLVIPNVFDADGGKFITIPLPHFFRALSSLGVIAGEYMNGKKTVSGSIESMFNSMIGDMTPVEIGTPQFKEPKTFTQSVTPTTIKPFVEAYVFNKDYRGKDIARRPFLDSQEGIVPQHTLAGAGTNNLLIKGSKWLNSLFGGGDYTTAEIEYDKESGDVSRNDWKQLIDLNPSRIEHVFEGVFGGRLNFFNGLYKTGESVAKYALDLDDNINTNNIPIFNRLYQGSYGSEHWKKFYEVRSNVADIDAKANEFMKVGSYNDFGTINNLGNATLVNDYKAYEGAVMSLNDILKIVKEGPMADEIKKQRDDIVKEFAQEITRMENEKKKRSKKVNIEY